jgi:hypothetical protein
MSYAQDAREYRRFMFKLDKAMKAMASAVNDASDAMGRWVKAQKQFDDMIAEDRQRQQALKKKATVVH